MTEEVTHVDEVVEAVETPVEEAVVADAPHADEASKPKEEAVETVEEEATKDEEVAE